MQKVLRDLKDLRKANMGKGIKRAERIEGLERSEEDGHGKGN